MFGKWYKQYSVVLQVGSKLIIDGTFQFMWLRSNFDFLKVFQAANVFMEPLHWLSGCVLWTSISQYILQWCWPDAYRTLQFWQRLIPIYLGWVCLLVQYHKWSLCSKCRCMHFYPINVFACQLKEVVESRFSYVAGIWVQSGRWEINVWRQERRHGLRGMNGVVEKCIS